MLKLFKRFVVKEDGQVIIIIALAFTLLLGFTALGIDIGVLYLEQVRLARAADAAALAGAQELPDTVRAASVARQYAQLNGLDPNVLTIGFSADNREITVSSSKDVNLYFARVLGFNSKTVNSAAVARISPVRALAGLIPLGINESLLPLSSGGEYMIKGGAQDGNPWRGILKYPGQGNGGNEYRDLVRNGYDGTVEIGDTLGKVPGNKSGPTSQGVEDRLGACTDGCAWDNYQPGCPRVVAVPIYRDLGSGGDNSLEVIGFAMMFLERVDGNGNDSRVWARFVPATVSGEADDSLTNAYLYSVRLSQ